MQITHFILDKILKLLTYTRLSNHQSLQSNVISKTVRFFGPPCRSCTRRYALDYTV